MKRVKCVDCKHECNIAWDKGITNLSGYCPNGDRYIGKHVNKHGINQSLHASRLCRGFQPKQEEQGPPCNECTEPIPCDAEDLEQCKTKRG